MPEYKWKGECQLVPPYGFFADGDLVTGKLPQKVIDDMILQGRIEPVLDGAKDDAPVGETAPILAKEK